MKSLTTRRSNLSKERIDILKRLVFGEEKEDVTVMKRYDNFEPDVQYENRVHENALGVLYQNLHGNKVQRKPLVYFFVGLIVGILSTLFLYTIVLVSDKDTIESDVKTVKETILEDKQINNETVLSPQDTSLVEGIIENEDGSKVYVVKEGDTLGGIVNRIYGDSSTYNPEKVERFKEVNGLKSIHVLNIGQKLVIPD